MFASNTFFVVIFVIFLGFVCCRRQPSEVADVEKNIVDTNPAGIAVLTQLKSTKSDSDDAIFSYKCTVGTYRSNRLACTAHDSTSWSSPHDVELKLRCPRSGSGLTLSYVEIVYSVSSPNVNCYVNEGAVGFGYIGVTVNAWNTLIFSYSASFYS